MDQKGHVLFIHSRSPYSTHDFIKILLYLPGDGIREAMYVEGGPEATLYLKVGQEEVEWVGSYETGFMAHDLNWNVWPLTNAIGIVRK